MTRHEPPRAPPALPSLSCQESWRDILEPAHHARLAHALAAYAVRCRWFRGKARTLRSAAVTDVVGSGERAVVVLLHLEYEGHDAETYVLPLIFAPHAADAAPPQAQPLIAELTLPPNAGSREPTRLGHLLDAVGDTSFGPSMLALMFDERALAGSHGELVGAWFRAREEGAPDPTLPQRISAAEQSNSSVLFGSTFMFKLLRVAAEGPSMEYEMGRFLASHAGGYRGAPRLVGAIEYRVPGREATTLATLFNFVPNQGDAWQLTLDALDGYFERRRSDDARGDAPSPSSRGAALLATAAELPAPPLTDWIGPYLGQARLLGVRTAELHQVLACERGDPLFAPQPFDLAHQRSLLDSANAQLSRVCERMRAQLPTLPAQSRPLVEELLGAQPAIALALARIAERELDALRIRAHGDYHLGQVLWTGQDFVAIDFEGEPARPLAQRRFKQCPLRDVAGMLRSFDYASATALRRSATSDDAMRRAAPWASEWTSWVSAAFLAGYREVLDGSSLLPGAAADLELLLEFYLLEKCIYEIGYELDNRPTWLEIPIRGLLARTQGVA
jgi:maltose alpha-D-glucosyltransferase / alpha-amylase